MIIYTCPKCGEDLQEMVLNSYPPMHKTYCSSCGWDSSEQEEIIRIPYMSQKTYTPQPCRNCSNHPSNGGSGICHCILGSQTIY